LPAAYARSTDILRTTRGRLGRINLPRETSRGFLDSIVILPAAYARSTDTLRTTCGRFACE